MSQILLETIEDVHALLTRHYSFQTQVRFTDFLIGDDESLGLGGRVLCEQGRDDLYLALQFGTPLVASLDSSEALSTNTLAVIAEEVSHFCLLVDAAERDSVLTETDLETLGEIDRFLVLLYWKGRSKLNAGQQRSNKDVLLEIENLHSLCDAVFSGQRFGPQISRLYVDAEAKAFLHLRRAFSQAWDNSHFNFFEFFEPAVRYLKSYRENILGVSVGRGQWRTSA